MRPRGMPSRWVRVLPWYYTERRQPSRAAEFRRALAGEDAGGCAEDSPPLEGTESDGGNGG